jgi:hypothetical protein
MTCRELAERVATEGVDALGAEERLHLAACHGCTVYVESIQVTVRSLGELPAEPADPQIRERLLAVFRERRG